MLPPELDWRSLATRSLKAGMSYLHEQLGDDRSSWRWGKVHRTRPTHPLSTIFPDVAGSLNPPPVELGGDGDTPQAAGYCTEEPFTIESTSVARYVFDVGNWNNSMWISPLGSSGHPGSHHYADQSQIWGNVELIPMLYEWDAIESSAESIQNLKTI